MNSGLAAPAHLVFDAARLWALTDQKLDNRIGTLLGGAVERRAAILRASSEV
jgi:hypothetical protein